MLFRSTRLALLIGAIALAPIGAAADTATPHPATPSAAPAGSHTLLFIVNITPQGSKEHPWTGDMTLKVNPEGIINGTYRSTSVKPDPFYGKIVTLTGGLQEKNIRLEFGAKGYFPVKGEYHAGQGIVATAHMGAGPPAMTSSGSTMGSRSSAIGSRSMAPTTSSLSQPYDFVAKQVPHF